MDMRMNTIRSGIQIGPRANGRATSLAAASDESRLRIRLQPQRPTRIRLSIKVIEQCRSCCRASGACPGRRLRMKQSFIVLLLALTVAAATCAAEQSQAEREVLDLEQKMNAAYAANDHSAYFAYC